MGEGSCKMPPAYTKTELVWIFYDRVPDLVDRRRKKANGESEEQQDRWRGGWAVLGMVPAQATVGSDTGGCTPLRKSSRKSQALRNISGALGAQAEEKGRTEQQKQMVVGRWSLPTPAALISAPSDQSTAGP